MCCSFWEKCKNSPKTSLGCSTPLRTSFCIRFPLTSTCEWPLTIGHEARPTFFFLFDLEKGSSNFMVWFWTVSQMQIHMTWAQLWGNPKPQVSPDQNQSGLGNIFKNIYGSGSLILGLSGSGYFYGSMRILSPRISGINLHLNQLCWKDHLVFICNAVCMYVQMDVCMYVCQISSTSKGINLRSPMRMQWPIFVKLGMWLVGGGGHKYYPRGLSSPNAHI